MSLVASNSSIVLKLLILKLKYYFFNFKSMILGLGLDTSSFALTSGLIQLCGNLTEIATIGLSGTACHYTSYMEAHASKPRPIITLTLPLTAFLYVFRSSNKFVIYMYICFGCNCCRKRSFLLSSRNLTQNVVECKYENSGILKEFLTVFSKLLYQIVSSLQTIVYCGLLNVPPIFSSISCSYN